MEQTTREFAVRSDGPGAYDLTDPVCKWVAGSDIRTGLLTLYVRHTSASLMIQENYDPQVMRDMEAFLRRLVPPGDSLFRHTAEGPDDMPAHVRSALTQTSLGLPVVDGEVALGTWQGIFLYEHRDHPHQRTVLGHLLGESS